MYKNNPVFYFVRLFAIFCILRLLGADCSAVRVVGLPESMPSLKGAPLKRPAFEGDSWQAVAADAKQMRLTPVTGLAMVHDSLPPLCLAPPVFRLQFSHSEEGQFTVFRLQCSLVLRLLFLST